MRARRESAVSPSDFQWWVERCLAAVAQFSYRPVACNRDNRGSDGPDARKLRGITVHCSWQNQGLYHACFSFRTG
jgi:hypothetical protein